MEKEALPVDRMAKMGPLAAADAQSCSAVTCTMEVDCCRGIIGVYWSLDCNFRHELDV